MDNNNLLVALDVGSSKVAVIVAEPGSDGVVKICGLGSAPSAGIRNGVVIDINAAVGSIRAAFDEAERTSGLHISEVYTACEDPRLRFFNNTGATPVRGTEIGQEELDAATEHAGAVALQGDAKVLKMQVLGYSVDGEAGILNPVGMSGKRLEATAHLACGLPTTATNLFRCVRRSGVEVKHWQIPVWAAADAVLTESEKELGVCLIDIGAGTVDVTVYSGNKPWYTDIIPVGGLAVTHDIAALFQLNEEEAERIKLKYGSADPTKFTGADVVDLSDIRRNTRPGDAIEVIAQEKLAEVVQARLEEILSFVKERLQSSKFDQMIPAGIVLTGGVTQTEGFLKLAEDVFEHNCRIGAPDIVASLGGAGNSPAWSVVAGLLKEVAHIEQKGRHSEEKGQKRLRKGFFSTIKHWFIGNY